MNSTSVAQTAELKTLLNNRHAQLREEIRQELLNADEQTYIDLAGRVHDSAEESVADLIGDLNIARVDRQLRQLQEVERALQRCNAGTYGVCQDCGGDVGYERLRSYPTAERCIACQTRHERLYAHEGTPRL